MPLSWNEIRDRSVAFSKEWKDETSETAEAQSFWNAFFTVFGVNRRRVARFEEPVKKSDGRDGFIDLLWKGVLLVEHKSRGKDLDRANKQATDYFAGLKDRDLPRYVLVSDFARFRLYDLDVSEDHEFELRDLHKNLKRFGFIAGYETRSFGEQDPVNVKAAEKLGKLHDQLKKSGYDDHPLEVFLVRILFCLFAEDNGIFETQQFREWVELRVAEDGSDFGPLLAQLFQTLNTPPQKRHKTLDEQLAAFQYINGKLFEEALPLASLNRQMRETVLECAAINWSRISPAIFGALFQSIKDKKLRRNLGEHYTSEVNILKALNPLFLDGLHDEFSRVQGDRKRLQAFHAKLGKIRILDPACGCGNFLVVAYRELRLIELDVLRELYKVGQASKILDVDQIVSVDVDQFYGIELEEFPAQIAQVALWMTDHQMNIRVSEEFGEYFARLPLKKSPTIIHDNALKIDWKAIVAPENLNYIVGNPPFIGHHLQSKEQKAEMLATYGKNKAAGVMDYVTGWYNKAAAYIQGTDIAVAFVSTNSIAQGEQVGILWRSLLSRHRIFIHFAHRTFQWTSEARGKAAVYCVIIGFGAVDNDAKVVFEYERPDGEPHAIAGKTINAYLVDAPWILLENKSRNQFGMPEMMYGSKPTDDGNFLFTDEEKIAFLEAEPKARKYISRLSAPMSICTPRSAGCCGWSAPIQPTLLNCRWFGNASKRWISSARPARRRPRAPIGIRRYSVKSRSLLTTTC